jgi:hypothetical protein
MGLFSRKDKEPLVHPDVQRSVYVRADIADVRSQLVDYSSIAPPKHSVPHTLRVYTAGPWVRVDLPPAVHPWCFHNLAFWLLDTPGVSAELVAVSGPSPTHPGYRLVRDPEASDALCGLDDDGTPWTVEVPSNRIVRGEPVPATDTFQLPADGELAPAGSVEVMLEDPGRAMNPTNGANAKSRKSLEASPFPI